ncbi:hypothetical protein [Thermomonas sp.]|uniref:hypothetical protein n=1 Tax=Thermomonas sp. TaxID=1971895 RepID=UPI0035AF9C87
MFDGLIPPEQSETLRQAVASAEDPYAYQLEQHISDQLVPDDHVSAVGRRYAAQAWVVYVLAMLAHSRGDEAAAWYYLSETRFRQGQLEADYVALKRIAQIKAAGRKGGQKTGLQSSPLMRQCIHLLAKKRPPTGWTSHEQAFVAIAPELIDFSTFEFGDVVTRDELASRVVSWIATRPDFRDAYEGKTSQT